MLFSVGLISYSQDPHFSNFNNNLLYYNPAAAGIDYGCKINMAYRRQWPEIPSKFQTYYFSIDQSVRIVRGTGGFGAIVTSNSEGEGSLQKINLGIPISVRIPFAVYSLIQVGVMPSFAFTNIIWDRFVFSGMLNPYYGNIYPSGFIPPDATTSTKSYADIGNIGAIYRFEKKMSGANYYKFYRKFELGFSALHLFNPNQSFTGSKAPLPAKYVLYTNYLFAFPLGFEGYMHVQPSALVEKQWKMFTYMLGIDMGLQNFGIDMGVWWRSKNFDVRNSDAIVVLFGYEYLINERKDLSLKISATYDITVSKLKDATAGSPEITLILRCGNSSFFNDKPDVCDEGSARMNKKKRQIRYK